MTGIPKWTSLPKHHAVYKLSELPISEALIKAPFTWQGFEILKLCEDFGRVGFEDFDRREGGVLLLAGAILLSKFYFRPDLASPLLRGKRGAATWTVLTIGTVITREVLAYQSFNRLNDVLHPLRSIEPEAVSRLSSSELAFVRYRKIHQNLDDYLLFFKDKQEAQDPQVLSYVLWGFLNSRTKHSFKSLFEKEFSWKNFPRCLSSLFLPVYSLTLCVENERGHTFLKPKVLKRLKELLLYLPKVKFNLYEETGSLANSLSSESLAHKNILTSLASLHRILYSQKIALKSSDHEEESNIIGISQYFYEELSKELELNLSYQDFLLLSQLE